MLSLASAAVAATFGAASPADESTPASDTTAVADNTPADVDAANTGGAAPAVVTAPACTGWSLFILDSTYFFVNHLS
jgi:hypothetical protein